MKLNRYNDSELMGQVRIAQIELTENSEVVFLFSNGISAIVPAHKLGRFALEAAVEVTFPVGGFN